MNSIPTGIVTFLFTDIEGSTKLAQDFPDTLQSALEKHHSILHKAFESNNGFVFEIVGDGFCCSFENVNDAVKAAVNVQINLSKENWDDVPVKIRIGIHVGPAEWKGNKYLGYLTLAKTHRVVSVAYGGQILISYDGFEFAKDSATLNKISFRDLGERRLKNIVQPVKLFQVISAELPSDFPPLKTLDARPNNLPVQLTSFVGRSKEIKEIKELLEQTHLLTITGPGGTGKSRLALEIGADLIDNFTNGVWVTELASVSDPSFVTLKIASALNLTEQKDKIISDTIIDFLKTKEILLILDNCEHLIDECAVVSEIFLKSCKGLKILCTGREPLHISGEILYQLSPLSFPTNEKLQIESLMNFETVRLFAERAMAVKTDFKITDSNVIVIAQLCRKLDGIPLAIELAAARLRTLSVENILENINDRFQFLTSKNRTALPRQQTLRAMIDWSYDLLSEKEKIFFKNLSVFVGGATLEAIEEVCSDTKLNKFEISEILSAIVDKSLIKYDEFKSIARYNMLETIRIYGKEKLAGDGDMAGAQKKHLYYYMRLSAESEEKLTGSDQKQWMKIMEPETDNIRESLRWSLDHEPISALKLSASLGIYWSIRGSFAEGYDFLYRGRERSGSNDKHLLAKSNLWMGFFKLQQGQYDYSTRHLEESIHQFRSTNEEKEIANSLSYLGTIAIYKGDFESAKKYQEECLAMRSKINDRRGIAGCLSNLGFISYSMGNFEAARKILAESLQLYREINDLRGVAANLGNLGKIETSMKNYELAKKYLEESLSISKELGDKYIYAHNLAGLSVIYLNFKNYGAACLLLSLSKSVFDELEVELKGDELSVFDRTIGILKSQIGAEEFESLWNEGKLLTLKQITENT